MPWPHGVDDRELDAAGIERVVEGVAADGVGRLEDPAQGHALCCAGQRREEAPLDLGGHRQGLAAPAAQDGVGVPPLADQQEDEQLRHRACERSGVVVPVAARQLQDADALGALRERHVHDGRIGPRGDHRSVRQRPACEGALDGLGLGHGAVVAEHLERQQAVVGDHDPRCVGAEQLARHLDDAGQLVRGDVPRAPQELGEHHGHLGASHRISGAVHGGDPTAVRRRSPRPSLLTRFSLRVLVGT